MVLRCSRLRLRCVIGVSVSELHAGREALVAEIPRGVGLTLAALTTARLDDGGQRTVLARLVFVPLGRVDVGAHASHPFPLECGLGTRGTSPGGGSCGPSSSPRSIQSWKNANTSTRPAKATREKTTRRRKPAGLMPHVPPAGSGFAQRERPMSGARADARGRRT